MNDFEGLLASDYGFKPSNKSAPMAASSAASSTARASAPSFSIGSRSARSSSNSIGGSLSGDADSVFAARSHDFGDILGGPARPGAKSGDAAFDFESMFASDTAAAPKPPPPSSEPVFDKPVYDDDDDGADVGDIFSGVPGIRSSSSKVKYDNVFASSASPPKGGNSSAFDDLLGGFVKAEPRWKSTGAPRVEKPEKSVPDFDDLLPGFRATSPPIDRSASEANRPSESSANTGKTASKTMEDPFAFTGKFSDPLDEISKFTNSRSVKTEFVGNGRLFDDVDPFDGLVKPSSSFSSERDNRGRDTSSLSTEANTGRSKSFTSKEPHEKLSVRSPDNQTERKVPVDNGWESHQTLFDMPSAPMDFHKSVGQTMSPPSYTSATFTDSNPHAVQSPSSEENAESFDDVWLSVTEIPLFTQPTIAPPPSRPPPPRPVSKAGMSSASTNARRKNEYSSFPNPSKVPDSTPAASRSSVASPFDELEDFARGRSPDNVDEQVNGLSGEELEMNSVAAAMKEAMDKAQAKFRQAKEVRERESTKAARNKEGQPERDERSTQEAREKLERLERQRLERHRLQREREEDEMEQQKLERLEKERERAREIGREREEKEREQRRIEKEKERAREIEREREKARLAVERATREARERAAVEARQRAERTKAEKAAVDKATAEARERAERAAVQRAQAEARERAAADAKERAEKAAAEAKEREARERAATARAEAEARNRAAERAAVGRAAAEARERAAAEARDRAAAAARANQQKNENDIESFFSTSNRATSAPRPRTNTSDPFFDPRFQNRQEPEVARPPSGNPSNIKKASSATNIVDDLSSIFNGASSTGEFQDVEGESEERRRARLERHRRAQERAAKALAEKNQRDLQIQREQAEKHRIGETLDVEIKRWAAGKEGNLRALLSTLQYVLWPESGWQPVSLTDMITAASVKKVYRKANLCIHPDKVQQKGANLQQKYVAEKVFDLIQEAWNKFNSEELF